jgi:hypothetical protein
MMRNMSTGVQKEDSMSIRKLGLLFPSLLWVMIPTPCFGVDFVMGDSTYPYSSVTKPAKGGSYTDPQCHTTITRITDPAADKPCASPAGVEYSTGSCLSTDGKYLPFELLREGAARQNILPSQTLHLAYKLQIILQLQQKNAPVPKLKRRVLQRRNLQDEFI